MKNKQADHQPQRQPIPLVRAGEKMGPNTWNRTNRVLNRWLGAGEPRQLNPEPQNRQRPPTGAVGWAVIESLGDETGSWVRVRKVTLNRQTMAFEIDAESTIVLTPPGVPAEYFEAFLVPAPIPAVLDDPTIVPQWLFASDGTLYVEQRTRERFVPLPVDAERSSCSLEVVP